MPVHPKQPAASLSCSSAWMARRCGAHLGPLSRGLHARVMKQPSTSTGPFQLIKVTVSCADCTTEPAGT